MKPADIPSLVEKSAVAEDRITDDEMETARRIQELGPAAIPYLLPLLKHRDQYVRKLASFTVRDMPGLREEHLDALIESRLKGDRWILPAIIRIGTPRAIALLVEELKKEKRPYTYTQVTGAFEVLGEKGVPCLVEIVKSGSLDGELFATVSFIFGRLGDKAESAIDPLIKFVSNRDGDVNARGWAVLVLGTIDKKAHRSLPTLLALTKDEPENFGVAVNDALLAMGVPEAVPGLLSRLEEKPDRYVISAFERLGENGKAAGPALVRYLSSDDREMRIAAARVMGRIGYTEANPYLIQLLRTKEDWRLVYVSAESLGRLHATDAIEALTDVSKEHWFSAVRAAAKQAINVIKGEATYEALDQKRSILPGFFDYMDVGTSDGLSVSEEDRRNDHPPYIDQGDRLDEAQLKKLVYKAQIGYADSTTDGGPVEMRVKTIDQVPEVGIRVAGGSLLGSDRGEWGGELVFVDSEGNQTIILHKNVQNICTLSSGIVAVTGLSHLMMDEGVLFKVTRGDDGTWHTSKWRVLPDAPLTSGLLANGNLYVGCYLGSVEVAPSGEMKAPER